MVKATDKGILQGFYGILARGLIRLDMRSFDHSSCSYLGIYIDPEARIW